MKMSLQELVLRGLEGCIADKYLGILVNEEWRDDDKADEAMRCQFEAKYMAEQCYAEITGLTK